MKCWQYALIERQHALQIHVRVTAHLHVTGMQRHGFVHTHAHNICALKQARVCYKALTGHHHKQQQQPVVDYLVML